MLLSVKRDERVSQFYKELINLGVERRDVTCLGQVGFIVRLVPSIAVQCSESGPHLAAMCTLASP